MPSVAFYASEISSRVTGLTSRIMMIRMFGLQERVHWTEVHRLDRAVSSLVISGKLERVRKGVYRPASARVCGSAWAVDDLTDGASRAAYARAVVAVAALDGPPSFRFIQHAVAVAHGLQRADLIAPGKFPHIVRARWMAMVMVRQATKASYPKLGAWFNRHHTSVLWAVQQSEMVPGSKLLRKRDNSKSVPEMVP